MELQLNHNKPLVMHIDLNSCFATVTQQAFPHLRGKPLVIAAYNSPRGCVGCANHRHPAGTGCPYAVETYLLRLFGIHIPKIY